MNAAAPTSALTHRPVVDSFAVAAQIRMTAAGTRARLAVAVPPEAPVSPNALIAALLTLGQQVLEEYRLTGQPLPEVEVTAVERVETVPAAAATTGFTVGVTNDLAAQRSTLVLDSDFLLGNDGGVLLAAATLLAGAEHLLDPAPVSRSRRTGGRPPPPAAAAQVAGAAAAAEPPQAPPAAPR
ncbi:hypothetical protein E7Z53_17275 [Kocuria salina]|uniref:hypothetical protein n=1 Tax=Kocuria salina TaxID=1929416 RepID=UPI0015947BCE|nr:hypothetical protein [Kocuria salina]NVC25177.1 hypothetical protein [Kocuria salina]